MPQVLVRYDPDIMGPTELINIGISARELIAEAVSTKGRGLMEHDIDWIACPHEAGSIASSFGIEIRTIGYPERRAKLNDKQTLLDLKATLLPIINDVIAKSGNPRVFRIEEPMIWVQFTEGEHV